MLEQRIASTREAIFSFCKSRGLNQDSVDLVAVTKTASAEQIEKAVQFGITDIAESRIQDWQKKLECLEGVINGVRKHFIGHLQTNKAKKAVELFDIIQSLDSIDLANEINKHAERAGKVQLCLVEIKVSGEENKFGLAPEGLLDFLNEAERFKNIKIAGLMTIAPYFDDPEDARPYFRRAKKIFDEAVGEGKRPDFKILSMGMTGDFIVALEEGSNMVRIGTGIFK